jgi:hypothetical protein
MPVMHACAHSTTLQVGLHLAATFFFEVVKAADMCSTLRIHNQCKCCTSAEFARCHPNFFFKMAHDKVFGIRCKILFCPVEMKLYFANTRLLTTCLNILLKFFSHGARRVRLINTPIDCAGSFHTCSSLYGIQREHQTPKQITDK